MSYRIYRFHPVYTIYIGAQASILQTCHGTPFSVPLCLGIHAPYFTNHGPFRIGSKIPRTEARVGLESVDGRHCQSQLSRSCLRALLPSVQAVHSHKSSSAKSMDTTSINSSSSAAGKEVAIKSLASSAKLGCLCEQFISLTDSERNEALSVSRLITYKGSYDLK